MGAGDELFTGKVPQIPTGVSLPGSGKGAPSTTSSPGTGSVKAANGTTITWSTAANGTVTAEGAGGAQMVVTSTGAGSAASQVHLEFSASGKGTYLTIDTTINESDHIVSVEVISGQLQMTLDLTVGSASNTVPGKASGKNGNTPVSWSGEVNLAAPLSTLAHVAGWPDNAFDQQAAEASYFGPACQALATAPTSQTPAMRAESTGAFFAKAAASATLAVIAAAATTATAGLDLVVVLAIAGLAAADASMIRDDITLVDESSNAPPGTDPGNTDPGDTDPGDTDPDDPGDGGCFAAGTLVSLGDGELRAIEKIEVDDLVASRDVHSRERGACRVKRTWTHRDKHTLDLTLATGEIVQTTWVHPIFTVERGKIAAGELSVGDHVETLSAGPQAILDIAPGSSAITVYNLTVDGLNTYFVGQSGVWVHNKDTQDPGDTGDTGDPGDSDPK